jgi:hypothetical protein
MLQKNEFSQFLATFLTEFYFSDAEKERMRSRAIADLLHAAPE